LDGQRVPVNAKEREQRKAGKSQSELFPYYGATGQVDWIDNFLFDEELVLLGEDGAPFLEPLRDKAYVIKGKSWVNNHAHVLRAISGLISNLYISHYLNIFDYHGYVTGTTRLKLNQAPMKKIAIPLAPLREQARIVARLEELFTRLDAGIKGLQTVRAQLKRYRQAVLKHAFEGKLTEEWRKTHRDRIEPAQKLLERIRRRKKINEKLETTQSVDMPEFILPESWALASLDELSEQIVDCLHSTPKFAIEGKYCVDTNCIEPNRILFEKARFVSEKTFEERIRRSKPKTGDVLFAREGTIGTAVTVPENVDVCLGQRMMMFRPDKEVSSLYFSWGLMSPFFENQWKAKVAGSTVAHINIRDIRQMLLPLASVEEQRILVEKVEHCLTIAIEADKTLNESFLRSEQMRQSILKDAFQGKLVPQEHGDEPAERLLKRIKEEKAKSKREEDANRKKDNLRQLELSNYVK
jgi:type I restriction enzyme S subunit